MDFKKATELFKDEDFDGEPVVIYEPGNDDDPVPPDPKDDGDDTGLKVEEPEGIYKARVSGVPVKIIAERVQYLSEEGQLITESYRNYSRKKIRSEFSSLDDFLRAWNDAKKKQLIIDELEGHGIDFNHLEKEIANGCGAFDLICHIAYDQPPLTRAERANNVRKRNYFTKYGDKARAILEALLDKYANEDIRAIENAQILKYKPFNEIGTPVEIISEIFGGKDEYEHAIEELEQAIYELKQSSGK
jgi:type I restriction enzyme R subunit